MKSLKKIAICLFCSMLSSAALAQDNSAAAFYRGKTISILVGYAPGGGYDLYARLLAQYLGRHLPGNPSIIVQNLPDAGGLRAARNLQSIAAKDGTALGMLAQTLPFDTALGYTAGVDAGKLRWLGRIAMNVEVGVVTAKSGVLSVDIARSREVPSGGTGGTASSTLVPFLLNKLAGTKFKLIAGYKSADEVLLAMERGEVDAVGAIGLSTMTAKHADQLKNGSFKLIYQNALDRHPAIKDVPALGELGKDAEAKEMLNLFASGSAIGRAIVAPQEVPNDRVAVLRNAIADTLADPDLIAYAQKANIALEPGSGEELEKIVESTMSAPSAVIAQTKAMLESLSTGK
jgi:tripartite-type tricarboxylate transporter receptor subunit TctC